VFSLHSCDDGDIITVELDFDGELDLCNFNTQDLMVYDTLEDPDEALLFIFERSATNEEIFTTPIPEESPRVFQLSDTDNRFIYRTYSDVPEFCEILDSNSGIVTSNNEADAGRVEVFTRIEDFDNDGIPTAVEDANEDGDNDPETNPTDTDGDGVPDYRDEDDDDDNVLTINEEPDPNGDGDVSDARNTDGDAFPDYLDPDDDGDTVPTRLESENQDPSSSFNPESPNPTTPRYRDDQSTDEFPDPGFRPTSYTRQVVTSFRVFEVDLGVIRFDERLFGTFTNNITIQNERAD
jgi:hypothetical protein